MPRGHDLGLGHGPRAEDIRLQSGTFKACKAELTKHCSDNEFGEGRMMKCLWENTDKYDYGEACRKARVDVVRGASLPKLIQDLRID